MDKCAAWNDRIVNPERFLWAVRFRPQEQIITTMNTTTAQKERYTYEIAWHVVRWEKTKLGYAGTKVNEFLCIGDAAREVKRLNSKGNG